MAKKAEKAETSVSVAGTFGIGNFTIDKVAGFSYSKEDGFTVVSEDGLTSFATLDPSFSVDVQGSDGE